MNRSLAYKLAGLKVGRNHRRRQAYVAYRTAPAFVMALMFLGWLVGFIFLIASSSILRFAFTH